ncbi:hypothetical protein ACU4GI_47110 (plasmid) [Cupriavidus basilensis]
MTLTAIDTPHDGLETGLVAEHDELLEAAEESRVALAAEAAESSGRDVIAAEANNDTDQALAADLIRRASAQRERGKQELKRKTAGIPSVQQHVILNDQVVASTFTRFFYLIDKGAELMRRRGDAIIGEDRAAKLREQLQALIGAAEAEVRKDLDATRALADRDAYEDGAIDVTYTAPTYEDTIQIRSREGLALQRVFTMYDQLLALMVNLEWNGKIDSSEVDAMRYRTKQKIRPIFRFAARANIGMQTSRARNAQPRPARDGRRASDANAKGDAAIVEAVSSLQQSLAEDSGAGTNDTAAL